MQYKNLVQSGRFDRLDEAQRFDRLDEAHSKVVQIDTVEVDNTHILFPEAFLRAPGL